MRDKINKQFLAALLEKKLDPVGREDGDVDNDGDEDESDQYILNRRKAIKKAIAKEEAAVKVKGTPRTGNNPFRGGRPTVKTEAELEESDSYYAMQKAKEHAKRDGKNYDGDVSVQHKYDAYHMKKRGYTHFTSGRFGNRTYHKGAAAGATKIDSSHYRGVSESVEEATAMTAPPKGSLGGSRPQKRYDAPKGTAKHHADMAAKHQEAAERHGNMAAEHDDAGNSDKADHHNDRMQYHDNAADAHENAAAMIKKHGADHPEAQNASKEASKHKLGESVEIKESYEEVAGDHDHMATTHKNAADHHRKLGNKKTADHHDKAAYHHGQAAQTLFKARGDKSFAYDHAEKAMHFAKQAETHAGHSEDAKSRKISSHARSDSADVFRGHRKVHHKNESIEEGIFGAGLGAGLGKMVGDNLAKSAGSLATKAAKSIASKGLAAKGAVAALGGADKIGSAVSKAAPYVGAGVGAVAGHKATRKNRREDVDYDEFAPLTEAEELFIEENQELVFEAVAELLYEENIDWQELTEEELNELIGRMARAINNRIGITRAGRTERDKRKAQKMLDKAVAIRQRTQAKQDRRDAKRELRRAKAGAKDASPRAILKRRSAELKQRQKDSRQKEADAMSKARETRMSQFRSSRS